MTIIPTLENLAFNETIIIRTRKHLVSLLYQILFFGFLFAVPFIIASVASAIGVPIFAYPAVNFLVVSFSIYYMMYLLIFVSEVISYYYDLLLVTKFSIIEIEQEGIFSRQVQQFHLEQIEDISSEITGFLPTFFNFGNLIIQTAGTKKQTVVKNIPNPSKVAAKIMEISKETAGEGNHTENHES